MSQVIFSVPGTPVAKGRAKFARRGNFVTTYTPKETVQYENLVRLAAQEAMAGADPFEGAIELIVAIYLPIPKSWSKKKQEKARAGLIAATKKPDCSNVIKALEDGMNGVVYTDDSRITDGIHKKRYSLSPRVDVIVRMLDLEVA